MLNTILVNNFYGGKMINKTALIFVCVVMFCLSLSSVSIAISGNGMPVKYISSCEFDFNNDDKLDIALLIDTTMGRELIVLMRNTDGYKVYALTTGKQDMHISCHFGNEIKETMAGKGDKKVETHKTNGTYLLVIYPESSSVAYFWKDNEFKAVWTSD